MSVSQNILSSNHTLTNINNYSGVFQAGANYEKFDFVYNTGDGLFYYARENITDGGNIVVSGENRFTLDPDGPTENGSETHYIYDELSEIGIIGVGIKEGQTINLEGSIYGANGSYEILSIEENFQDIPIFGQEDYDQYVVRGKGLLGYYNDPSNTWDYDQDGTPDPVQSKTRAEFGESHWRLLGKNEGRTMYYFSEILQALDATEIQDNWYQSSWFLKSHEGTSAEIDFTFFNFNSVNDGWIFSAQLGWIFISPVNANAVWFFIGETNQPSINNGVWMYAEKSHTANGYLFLHEDAFDQRFGPAGSWLYITKINDPKYVLGMYNYENGRWYGIENGTRGVDGLVDQSNITVPTAPANPVSREVDGISSRIQIKKADSSSRVSTFEKKGNHSITLSALTFSPSQNPDKWTKDKFFFDADYGSSVDFTALNIKTEFGNGYYEIRPRGINSIRFEANLEFKNRTNKEANAIIHFLENHQGQHQKDSSSSNLKYSQGISGFRWDGSSAFHPYDSVEVQTKNFYCQDFSHSLTFENNNDLNIKLSNFDTSILKKSEDLFVKRPADYDDAFQYELNDIAFSTGNHKYYYWSGDSAAGRPPVQENSEWTRESGYFTDINTEYWSRDFFWKPSLGLSVNQQPRMLNIESVEGYNQVYKDGINESLLKLDLNFNNRDDDEAYAILHFLEQHIGSVPFLFKPPSPYDRLQNFICQKWSHKYTFKNNHSISASFEQFPFNFSAQEIDSSVSPPTLSLGELSFNSQIILANEEDGVRRLSPWRYRVNIQNIGDDPVQINLMRFNGPNKDSFYFLGSLGGGNQQSIPVIKKSGGLDLRFTIPSNTQQTLSTSVPFNLQGAKIELSKNFAQGVEGGQSFKLMQGGADKSEWEPVKENGKEVVFTQKNHGTIIKHPTSPSIPSMTESCRYFIATQFFENNAINILQGGQEAFFDIIYDDETINEKLYYFVDSSGNRMTYNLTTEDQQYEAYINKYHSKYWSVNSVKNRGDINYGKIELVSNSPPFNEYYLTKSQYGKQVWQGALPGKANDHELPAQTGPIVFGVARGFYNSSIEIQSDGLYNPQSAQIKIYI